jgi:integrase
VQKIEDEFNACMSDDFNTALALSNLFGYFKDMKKWLSAGKTGDLFAALSAAVQIRKTYALLGLFVKNAKEYKAWYEEYREMHGDKWENSNRLFIGEYGGNIYPGTINMWMKRICQTAGLEERTVHSLRHTNITMQITAGVPIVTVAGRAGHARTSTTTDIYSHFLKTADRSAAQKLEEIFE